MKRRPRESNKPVHHIVCDELEGATQAVINLPKIDGLKRTTLRGETNDKCNSFHPQEFKSTNKRRWFFVIRFWSRSTVISHFWDTNKSWMLHASQIWLSDGIFKTASGLYSQVYCIHGLRLLQTFAGWTLYLVTLLFYQKKQKSSFIQGWWSKLKYS